jgi:capsular exopolysaccharide synthesis family protein
MSEIFKALNKTGSLQGDLKPPKSEAAIEPIEPTVPLPLLDESTVELGRVRDRAFKSVIRSDHGVAEQLRVLRTKVKVLRETPSCNCVGVVSAAPGDGKSTIALGLATSLAQERDLRVLLIEADLRHPVMTERLGLLPSPGLSDWLSGNLETVPLLRVDPLGFVLLPGGSPADKPTELLESEPMRRLLDICGQSFDFTVVDCTPITPVADTVVLQDLLDGFLLVVRSRKTQEETLLGALSHVKEGVIKGVIFNDHRVILQ